MDAIPLRPDDGAAAGEWQATRHPLRRYGARFIDVQLFGGGALGIIGVLVGLLAPDPVFEWVADEARWKDLLLYGPLSWIISAPIVAASVAWKGTTPGKLLFGLRVRSATTSPILFTQVLRREGLLLLWGVGLGLPLLSLAMMARSYNDVETGEARWDEKTALTVQARRVAGWQLAGVIVGTGLVLAMLLWTFAERILRAGGQF